MNDCLEGRSRERRVLEELNRKMIHRFTGDMNPSGCYRKTPKSGTASTERAAVDACYCLRYLYDVGSDFRFLHSGYK